MKISAYGARRRPLRFETLVLRVAQSLLYVLWTVFATTLVAAQAKASTETHNTQAAKKYAPPIAPNGLSVQFLHETGEVGHPQLIIGWYDLTEGLFAGYQATSGKRILFRTRWKDGSAILAEVVHLNPANGKAERVIGPRNDFETNPEAPRRYIEVMGVDLLKSAKRSGAKGERDVLTGFMQADVGQAFAEGVPVLFAALEDLEEGPQHAQLQAVFGAVLSMLQIHSGVFIQSAHTEAIEAIVGGEHAKKMREACVGKDCIMHGRNFMIHRNGLFDTFSRPKKVSELKLQRQFTSRFLDGTVDLSVSSRIGRPKSDYDDCAPDFGYCGPGTFHPGDIITPACTRHDRCVCYYSHLECINFPPDEPPGGFCPDCGTLFEAIESYLVEVFGNHPPSPEEVEESNWWGDSPG